MPTITIRLTIDGSFLEYTGVPRTTVTPVFKMACRLRFKNPNVDMLLGYIDTQLDHPVISALIEAALRLLPPEITPEGGAEANKRIQSKMAKALLNETTFIGQMRSFRYQFQTESEQKEAHLRPTPDIRFPKPVLIQGRPCYWVEYKSYFQLQIQSLRYFEEQK